MIFSGITQLVDLCAKFGVHNAVLSPGSRNAPISISFSRHPKIKTLVVGDERSAAFIALGVALKTKSPVVLNCTSGTAGYNYAPAVTEAFYQNVPLIVITADRPPEWIDQWDGQAIHQENLYQPHVKENFFLPVADNDPSTINAYKNACVNALQLSIDNPQGPVHLNIPLREPLYPDKNEQINLKQISQPIESSKTNGKQIQYEVNELKNDLEKFRRKLIVVGQNSLNYELIEILDLISGQHKIPVVSDAISNLHLMENGIIGADSFMFDYASKNRQSLQPSLLITSGKSLISKNLKLFFRDFKPEAHWHILPAGRPGDPFKSLTKTVYGEPYNLYKKLGKADITRHEEQEVFYNHWQDANCNTTKNIETLFNQKNFGEFEAVRLIINSLPKNIDLHLANSTPVRYVNYLGNSLKGKQAEVFANRGTSGIDGCLSTAVGNALSTDNMVVVIIGDMAFFYDRNALWHNHLTNNLRVIVLNNHGGGIFRIIPGPTSQPEFKKIFETEQKLSAKNTARDFNLDYYHCDNFSKLKKVIPGFFKTNGKSKILEIESKGENNQTIFEEFKTRITKGYGT